MPSHELSSSPRASAFVLPRLNVDATVRDPDRVRRDVRRSRWSLDLTIANTEAGPVPRTSHNIEAWQRFVDTVQPPPVEVTDIYWGEAPQDAIAEAEAVQDLPDDPYLILRLSEQFFRLSPSSQIVTLLHETIRMSLDLTGKRLQQADNLSKGHFQGKTRSEQAFETQRIELARGLYLFPDEVMAEKHLQQDYPAFAADRLGHYNDIQERASETVITRPQSLD